MASLLSTFFLLCKMPPLRLKMAPLSLKVTTHLPLFLVAFYFFFVISCSEPTSSDVLLLLHKIRPALQGSVANRELDSWSTSVPLCLWRGLRWSSSSYAGAYLLCDRDADLRANVSLASDPSLQLLSIRLPAAALKGALPPELGQLPSLRVLSLAVNFLTGQFPLELGNAPALVDLDLAGNRLAGPLPPSLWNLCSRIVSLRLHGNRFSGGIPEPADPELSCDRLKNLDLGGNRLEGGFPQFVAGFRRLTELDLSSNKLSGSLPDTLAGLQSLERLNLSGNNFTGPLPSVFARSNFKAEAFQGNNAGLCGPPLGKCDVQSRLNSGRIAGVMIGLIATAVVLASASIGWAQRKKRRDRARNMDEDDKMDMADTEANGSGGSRLIVFQGGEHLTLEDVLNATGQVMEKTSYGTVYKAKLADGGTIALRLLREGSCKDLTTCLPVVRELARAHHEHLVALRAFYQGRRGEKLLIYDYMPTRSLHDLLHETRAGRPLLNWARRHKIALGVARALAHLHGARESPITHGNVRSSNVLVDDFFVARLTEYGLNKLVVPAVADELISAAKSDGYKAPELQKMNKCSPKTDVYAFGILLLEMLMGKKPSGGGGRDGCANLPLLVKVAVLEETMMEVFDVDVLKGIRSPAEEGLVQALKLAMGCCSPVASARPDMVEVAKQLEENRPRNRSSLYSPADRSEIGTPF